MASGGGLPCRGGGGGGGDLARRSRSLVAGAPTFDFDQFLAWIGQELVRRPVGPDDEINDLTGGDQLVLHLLLRKVDALRARPHPIVGDLFAIMTVRHLYSFYLYADSAPPEAR